MTSETEKEMLVRVIARTVMESLKGLGEREINLCLK